MGNPSDKSPELVTIAAAPSVLNANIIVTTLEAEGITAFIPDENTSTILSHMNFAINPYDTFEYKLFAFSPGVDAGGCQNFL